MPSATRDALSRSMADLNFDPTPHKRRAQTNRNKRDLSQSCSAFNFVLDPSELGQAREESKTRSKGGKGSGTGGSKPSYSDLIMDATSKAAAAAASATSQFPQLESPTSVIEEGEENAMDASRQSAPEETTTTTNQSQVESTKPTRSIPSNADFNRSRNRNLKSRSNHDASASGAAAAADPMTPGARARRNRKARAGSGKFSKSCHMSFADFGAAAEEGFEEADFSTLPPPPPPSSSGAATFKSPRAAAKNSSHDRFSKSFSDFGDWENAPEMNTPTRRGRKKPVSRSKSDDSYTAPATAASDFSNKEQFSSQELSGEFSSVAEPRDQDPTFENSFTEMDLLSAKQDSPPVKRSSKESETTAGAGGGGTERRFSHSFGELDFSQQQDVVTTPKRHRRRSIDSLEPTTKVETSKVSLEEFHAPGEEATAAATSSNNNKRPIRKTRSKQKEMRGESSRQNSSGMRLRRSNTTDGGGPIRSSRSLAADGGGARRTRGGSPKRSPRESSPAPSPSKSLTRNNSNTEDPEMSMSVIRSNSHDKRGGRRRRASMDAKISSSSAAAGHGGDDANDSPSGQRRTPRRTKSGDASGPVRGGGGMRDRSSAGERPSGRRGGIPRRTKSSDGSSMTFSRSRIPRSTSMGHGPGVDVDRNMNQSMSQFSGMETPTRSPSGSGDRLAGRGDKVAPSSRSTSAPRRKTPARSKSHSHDGSGGGGTLNRRTSRDRERGDKESRGSSTRERNDNELRISSSRHGDKSRNDKELRGSRGASGANRRAMAHSILKE